jgi:hypothetical protein
MRYEEGNVRQTERKQKSILSAGYFCQTNKKGLTHSGKALFIKNVGRTKQTRTADPHHVKVVL